jgi:hypothetical protein
MMIEIGANLALMIKSLALIIGGAFVVATFIRRL